VTQRLQPAATHLQEGAPQFREPVGRIIEHAQHRRKLVVAESEPSLVRVDSDPYVLGEVTVAGRLEEHSELRHRGSGNLDTGDVHVAHMPVCQDGKRLPVIVSVGRREKLLPKRLEVVYGVLPELGEDRCGFPLGETEVGEVLVDRVAEPVRDRSISVAVHSCCELGDGPSRDGDAGDVDHDSVLGATR
jgi:hypothetical protein